MRAWIVGGSSAGTGGARQRRPGPTTCGAAAADGTPDGRWMDAAGSARRLRLFASGRLHSRFDHGPGLNSASLAGGGLPSRRPTRRDRQFRPCFARWRSAATASITSTATFPHRTRVPAASRRICRRSQESQHAGFAGYWAPADTDVENFTLRRAGAVSGDRTYRALSRVRAIDAGTQLESAMDPRNVLTVGKLTSTIWSPRIGLKRHARDPEFTTPPSGSLFSGQPVSGIQYVTFKASDRGGGIKSMGLLVDGVPSATGSWTPRRRRARSRTRRSCPARCGRADDGRRHAQLANGPHTVRVTVTDVAGQRHAVGPVHGHRSQRWAAERGECEPDGEGRGVVQDDAQAPDGRDGELHGNGGRSKGASRTSGRAADRRRGAEPHGDGDAAGEQAADDRDGGHRPEGAVQVHRAARVVAADQGRVSGVHARRRGCRGGGAHAQRPGAGDASPSRRDACATAAWPRSAAGCSEGRGSSGRR